MTYSDNYNIDSTKYDFATHYCYDIHGNVKTLWQDNKGILSYLPSSLANQRMKRIDYDYDLVSGKVNYVYYQRDSNDCFAHHYEYDADNRITNVWTTSNYTLQLLIGITMQNIFILQQGLLLV